MQEAGKTKKEIGEALGYTKKQIMNVIERHRRNERKAASGKTPQKRGRPPKYHAVTEQDKLIDLRYKLSRKDYRIKQLEMENELLRDFLKETGRK